MSNSSTIDSNSFVDTIAQTFFTWFHSDILPVCAAIVDISVILIGAVLNVLLLVTFRKRGLFNEPSTHYLLNLCVADFGSYIFLLIPTIITAIAKDWLLSSPVCNIHGGFMFFFVFASYGFATVLSIERAVKICAQDSETYDKIFDNPKARTVLILLVWILASILSYIPSGLGLVAYDFYHQGCSIDYTQGSSGPAFLIVHFLLSVVVSTVLVIICYALIFKTRHDAVKLNRDADFKKTNSKKDGRQSLISGTSDDGSLPTISENDDDFSAENGTIRKVAPQAFVDKPKKPQPPKANGKRRKSARRQSMLFEVFSDDEENPAFHLAVTYLFLWCIILACHLPYVIICFYGTFDSSQVWGGFYTITMLVVHVSFAIKPVIYLGHNRHYRQVTKQTIPEGMRNAAGSVRSSFSTMAGVVEDFVFKSKANKQFKAAMATQKAVLIWKRKVKKRQGVFQLKNTEPDNHSVPIPAPSASHAPATADVKTTNGHLANGHHLGQQPGINHAANRTAVTPSDVKVSSAGPEPSSFIEKERLRMYNAGGGAAGMSSNKTSTSNVSPVPGMIDDSAKYLSNV